jgi:transposase
MTAVVTEELIARQAPEAQQIIRALLAQVQALQQRVAELEQRLNLTPANSSLPPSSVHPHAKPAPKPHKGKRKPGGQPGHVQHTRVLIPTDQCDQVLPVKPQACRRCGNALHGDDPQPLRHQVVELPPIRPVVTEYQRHRLVCPCCRTSTCGELPEGVPASCAGPRLVAFTALLMAHYRQSKRRCAHFLSTVFGIEASPGWVVKLQNQAAQAVAAPYQQLTEQLPVQPVLGIDESPTKQAQHKAWLWTFVAGCFTVFAYRLTKAAAVPRELLGEDFDGVITCDRAKMYWSCAGKLQWCWAHLKRDIQALIDSSDRVVQRLGHDLMRPTRQLFALWSRVRDGTLARRAFVRQMAPLRLRVERLLLRGKMSGHATLASKCRELWEHKEWLWTFVEVEGVEPTNNASERALRHGVIWRKLSFGTQSATGSVFVERMLTVIETCRQQSRDVFAYLSQALEAHFAHTQAPSLLPNS